MFNENDYTGRKGAAGTFAARAFFIAGGVVCAWLLVAGAYAFKLLVVVGLLGWLMIKLTGRLRHR